MLPVCWILMGVFLGREKTSKHDICASRPPCHEASVHQPRVPSSAARSLSGLLRAGALTNILSLSRKFTFYRASAILLTIFFHMRPTML